MRRRGRLGAALAAVLLAGLAAGPADALGGMRTRAPIAVPAVASGNGLSTLAFNQDALTGFDIQEDGVTGDHVWYNGLWFGAPSYYSVASQYISADIAGEIHLQWVSAFATTGCPLPTTTASACPLATISTAARDLAHARAFGHGYYEWVVKFTPADNSAWSAEWLLGLQTGRACLAGGFPTLPLASGAPYSEIDNEWGLNDAELHESLHDSASDTQCGVTGATLAYTHAVASPGDPTVFHTVGLLWCGSGVGSVCGGTPGFCWFLDGTDEGCTNTASETETQLHMINLWLAEQCSNQPNSSSCSPPSQIDMYVKSVRYWSCATWQANALAC
jgi:hypothetical protein